MTSADIELPTAAIMIVLRLFAFRAPETSRPSHKNVSEEPKLF
jgi:hypothetical protein